MAAVTILAVAASAAVVLLARLTGPAGALPAGALSGVLTINSPPVAIYAAAQP